MIKITRVEMGCNHLFTRRMLFAVIFWTMLISSSLFTEVPRIMNYQGKITNPAGVALNGTDTIAFFIYDTSEAGTALWGETLSVDIVNGLFEVQLGNTHPINLDFSEPYWMELSISTDGGTTWETFSPREKLAPVSFAYRSIYADTAEYADTAGYAETSSSSGGGNLNVYKSDGTTKLGLYLGCFATGTDNYGCGFHCGWAYALSTGGVHRVWSGDYRSTFGHTRLYYRDPNCTGRILVAYGSGYKGGKDSACNSRIFATDSTIYASGPGPDYCTDRSYSSYRDYGGSCVNSSGSVYSTYASKVCEEPDCNFVCGDDPCIIKP